MIERLSVGARVGDCILERQLGRGGMGAVYLARHVELGVRYALKVQHLGGARAAQRAERFRREAQALAKVDRHPGIVGIHQFGVVDGSELAYCLLDLVEGQDLAEHLKQAERLPLESVLAWAEQVARALAHVHAAGIVHRDLKPANILIRSADQQALLTDFGLAKDASERERLTVTGQMVGTVHYMAPEQVTAERDSIGPKSDVFALGAVLYEMVCGDPPFSGGNLFELTAQICNSDPDRFALTRSDVPADLEQLVQACLSKDPERRPAALEVAEGLAQIGRGEPLGWSRRSSSLWRFRQAIRRRDPQAVAGVLGLVLALAIPVGLVAYHVMGRRPAAAVRAEQARFAAWQAHTLTPCAFGLGAGPAPARDEVDAWIARLSPQADQWTDELAELRAYRRWLELRDGAPVALSGEAGPARIVDALILVERGQLERARDVLAKESGEGLVLRLVRQAITARLDPARFFVGLERSTGGAREAARALVPTAAAVMWRKTCEAGARGRDVSAQLASLRKLEELSELDEADLARIKRAALEQAASAWAKQLEVVGEEERVLRRLAGLIGVPPAVEPGPLLLAACEGVLSRLAKSCRESPRRGPQNLSPQARRFLACERQVHFGIAPGRRLIPEIRSVLEDFAFGQASHGEVDSELFLQAFRYGVSQEARGLAKKLTPAMLRELRQLHPGDLAVEALALTGLLNRLRPAQKVPPQKLRQLVAGLEQLLKRDLSSSLAPKYQAELSLRLATRLRVLSLKAPGEVPQLAARAIGPVRRYQAFANVHLPARDDDLLDSYWIRAWAESKGSKGRKAERVCAQVYEQGIPVFEWRLKAGNDGRVSIARFELGSVQSAAAGCWLRAGDPQRALALAKQAQQVVGRSEYRPYLRDRIEKLLKRTEASLGAQSD